MASPAEPSPSEDPIDRRLRDPGRIEALTDGVFAIVLTILVLEIAVPADLSSDSLRRVLEELRPTLAAWVTSFLIVGMYWVGHRDLFARVRYANRDLVWLNLLFLLPVSLIPFGASVIGEYPDEPIGLQLYGTIVIAAAVMRWALYSYVWHRPFLLEESPSRRDTRINQAMTWFALPMYVVATALASVSTTASRLAFFAGPFLYFATIAIMRDRPTRRADSDGTAGG